MNETTGQEERAAESRRGESEWREQHSGTVEPTFIGDTIEFTSVGEPVREGYDAAHREDALTYTQVENTPPEASEILLDISDYETAVAAAESIGKESILKEALERYKNAQTVEEKKMIFENELKPLREIEKSIKETLF